MNHYIEVLKKIIALLEQVEDFGYYIEGLSETAYETQIINPEDLKH